VIGWTSGGVTPGLVCIGMDKPLRTAERLAEDRTDEQGPARAAGWGGRSKRQDLLARCPRSSLFSASMESRGIPFNLPGQFTRRPVARPSSGGAWRAFRVEAALVPRPWPRAAGLFPHSRAGIFAGNPGAAAIALADRRANRSPIQPRSSNSTAAATAR
jgi:hypothetical protein